MIIQIAQNIYFSELYKVDIDTDPPRLELDSIKSEQPKLTVPLTDARVRWTEDVDPKTLSKADKIRWQTAMRQRNQRLQAKKAKEEAKRLEL